MTKSANFALPIYNFYSQVALKCQIWLISRYKMPVGNASDAQVNKQESLANAEGTRDSGACVKAHCEPFMLKILCAACSGLSSDFGAVWFWNVCRSLKSE